MITIKKSMSFVLSIMLVLGCCGFTCFNNNISAKSTVNITAIDGYTFGYAQGSHYTLNPKANGKALSGCKFTSSNTNVAKVDTNGKVTSQNGGTATITISHNSTSSYNYTSKKVTITVPSVRSRKTALNVWRDKMIEVYDSIYGYEYRFGSPTKYTKTKINGVYVYKTGDNEKSQTCLTLPNVALKDLGLTSGAIWMKAEKTGDDRNYSMLPNDTVKSLKNNSKQLSFPFLAKDPNYPNSTPKKKSVKELVANGTIQYGDIVCVQGHTFVYMGESATSRACYQSGTIREIGNGAKVVWGYSVNPDGSYKEPIGQTPEIKRQISNTKTIMSNWRSGKIASSKFTGSTISDRCWNGGDKANTVIVCRINTFRITTKCRNGKITTSNIYMAGQNQKVSYSPMNNRKIKSVTVDGKAVSTSTYKSSYTFNNLDADHTIEVVYE